MTQKIVRFNPLTFLVTLSSIRCLTLFLTFLDYSFFKNTITIYLFNYLMSLSFSSCRVVFTSLIFILISFCLFCDMINSGIIKALIFWTLIQTRWMVLWSIRFTQVFSTKVFFHGCTKHVWDTSYLVAIYQKSIIISVAELDFPAGMQSLSWQCCCWKCNSYVCHCVNTIHQQPAWVQSSLVTSTLGNDEQWAREGIQLYEWNLYWCLTSSFFFTFQKQIKQFSKAGIAHHYSHW